MQIEIKRTGQASLALAADRNSWGQGGGLQDARGAAICDAKPAYDLAYRIAFGKSFV
jgi:hypothetical protein